jgi:hypothetical protein
LRKSKSSGVVDSELRAFDEDQPDDIDGGDEDENEED